MSGREVWRDLQAAFNGGLNTNADESQVKANEIRQGENCLLTEQGGVTKRRGTQRTHDTGLAGTDSVIRAGLSWRRTSPATHLVVSGGHLFSAPHGSYPWIFSDLGSGIDPTVFPSLVSFRDAAADAVYLADGGQLHRYKASGLALNLPGSPNVGRLAVHNLRLWACGDPAAPETVYFSGLNNGDTLGSIPSGGGSAIIRTFAHEPLTGLLPVGQSLLLFHERGISRFTGWGQSDFSVDSGTRGVTQDVGTIAPNSIVGVENVGFFMSDRGAYAATESGVQQISANIENTLAAIPTADLLQVSAGHYRAGRQVWFSIPNLGVMVYSYRLKAWAGPLVGLYGTPCLFWDSGAGSAPQLFFGTSDGFVRQAEVVGLATDDVLANGSGGDPYTLAVRCHRMFFGDPTIEKSLEHAYVTSNLRGSAGASISWETGQESGSEVLPEDGTTALWNHGLWGHGLWGVGGSSTKRIHTNGRGHYADFRIIDDGITIPLFSRLEAQAFAMGGRY